jgi:hypothetical protein
MHWLVGAIHSRGARQSAAADVAHLCTQHVALRHPKLYQCPFFGMFGIQEGEAVHHSAQSLTNTGVRKASVFHYGPAHTCIETTSVCFSFDTRGTKAGRPGSGYLASSLLISWRSPKCSSGMTVRRNCGNLEHYNFNCWSRMQPRPPQPSKLRCVTSVGFGVGCTSSDLIW